MRKILPFVLIFVCAAVASAQNSDLDLSSYGVKIEPDRRLMTVLATLEMARTKNAAGAETWLINTPLTATGTSFRQRVRVDTADLNEDLRGRITQFLVQYKRRHADLTDAQIVAAFVSMAYSLAPAPDLSDPARTTDLPGDLLEVLDFAPLVREFYRRFYSTKIEEYLKEYQTAGDALRPSAREMVSDLAGYLHTRPQLVIYDKIKTETKDAKGKNTIQKIETRERTRRFLIVPELLAPKGTINFLNIRDDYFAIVPPETNLTASEARRGFLQFVVDPLVFNNAKDIGGMSSGIKTLLDEQRKQNSEISPDIFRAVTHSLIAAADARQIEAQKTAIATAQARRKIDQMKTVEEKKAVSAELDAFKKLLADETALQLSEAYERGAVLAFYFADQLKGSEDSGFDIAASLRDIILSLDAAKETNRLAQFADAKKRALAARAERRKNSGSEEIIIENPVTQKLLEIDQTVKAKNYAQAETDLKKLLAENPNESRIYYSIGRTASLAAETITNETARNNKLLEAKVAYENVIRSSGKNPDAALISLTYVALARLYEFFGDSAYAIKIYEAAIKIGDISGGAYKEAIAARDRLMKEQ